MRGSLVKARGDVMVRINGSTTWTRAHERMGIGQGDRIKTGPGGEAVVRISPRNLISIQPNSEMGINIATVRTERGEGNGIIRVPRQVQRIEADLSRGRITNVVKGLPRNSEYRVITPVAVAGVRGTVFMCGISATGAAEFACFEGQISLGPTPGGNGNFEPLVLDPGQFVSITPVAPSSLPDAVPGGEPAPAGSAPSAPSGVVTAIPEATASEVVVSTIAVQTSSGDFSTTTTLLETAATEVISTTSTSSTSTTAVECF